MWIMPTSKSRPEWEEGTPQGSTTQRSPMTFPPMLKARDRVLLIRHSDSRTMSGRQGCCPLKFVEQMDGVRGDSLREQHLNQDPWQNLVIDEGKKEGMFQEKGREKFMFRIQMKLFYYSFPNGDGKYLQIKTWRP